MLLFNSDMQTLEYAAGRGFHTEAYKYSHIRLGEGIAGVSALEQRLVQVSDFPGSSDSLRVSQLQDERFAAYTSVPFLTKGQLKGILEIFHRTPFHPNAEWPNFLEGLAGQMAIAIDNAQLFEYLQRSNANLLTAYDATLEGGRGRSICVIRKPRNILNA